MSYLDKVTWTDLAVDGVTMGWAWPNQDEAVWQLMPNEWVGIKNVIEKYVRTPNVAIQAGGCVGVYPRMMSQLFKLVYTFEPHPINFHCLVANCQEDNIIKINGALGGGTGLSKLVEHNMSNTGMHHMAFSPRERPKEEHTGKTYTTQIFTIDSLQLTECDFIQLDVEGFEEAVILGSVRTIIKHGPVIMCEFPTDAVITKLRSLGYEKVEEAFGNAVFVR